MKNSPSVKICKKKRKSERRLNRIFQRALTDCNQLKNALQPARNLRLRNSSPIKQTLHPCRYRFKLTRAVKRNISKIKRTFINETISPVQNTNRISISDRITSQISTTGCKSFSLPGKFVCSPKFLEHRSLKMAKIPNKSSESIQTFPNIIITFEEMLNIRKKRLDKKHQRSCTKTSESNDSVVEIIDEADTTVNCNNDKHEFCEMVVEEKNQDIIEIGDDTSVVINCENNNIEKNCDIKYYNIDHTEKNDQHVEIRQTEVAPLTSEISNNMEETKRNEYAEVVNSVEKNHNIIDIDVLAIDDSIVNTMPELPSAIKIMETPEKVTSANDINNQSIVFITPNRNDLPKTKPIDKKLKRSRWSSNSVITISDTPGLSQDISDNDIIFVSQSTTSSSPKKRRLDRKPSVVIIDDDDSKRTVGCHSVQRPRKKKGKKRTKRKKNVTVSNTSTGTSELASCADTNCINIPNRNQGLGLKMYPTYCACPQSKNACASTPNLLTIPEESATAAQSHRDKHESTEMRVHHSGTVNNKFGSNIHNAGHVVREGLRMIIIDGSNVALGHSNGAVFSVKGLQIAIDYFLKKGHVVKAFVPQYRVKRGQCTNPFLLQHLAAKRLVILTPSREVKGRRITPYDDRYVIQYATAFEGIVVSNDNFRDILAEHPEWRHTIEKRLLMYTWIDDVLIFPEDPLGRHGPNLSRFLRFP